MISGTSRTRLALALAGGLLLLAGCSDDGPGSSDPAGGSPAADASSDASDVPLIVPGSPGESASTMGPGDVEIEDPWNHADVAFAQMMIPHHGQALTMSELAATRAADPRVKRLAERISAAQGPEILVMAAWLEERDIEVPRAAEDPADYDHGDHGHNEMQGMLTPAQMKALEQASGPRFDRLFLTGMIRHHQGAIAMAEDVARDGAHLRINELAADVMVGQQVEIERMRELLG